MRWIQQYCSERFYCDGLSRELPGCVLVCNETNVKRTWRQKERVLFTWSAQSQLFLSLVLNIFRFWGRVQTDITLTHQAVSSHRVGGRGWCHAPVCLCTISQSSKIKQSKTAGSSKSVIDHLLSVQWSFFCFCCLTAFSQTVYRLYSVCVCVYSVSPVRVLGVASSSSSSHWASSSLIPSHAPPLLLPDWLLGGPLW